MRNKSQTPGNIVNRRARFDYELGDSFVVGLQLLGGETKALRMGHGQLRGAYVNVLNNELWLVGAQIIAWADLLSYAGEYVALSACEPAPPVTPLISPHGRATRRQT